MASSSAMTTRTVTVLACLPWSAGLCHEPLEQLVLRPLQLFDRSRDCGPAASHGVGVALRLVMLAVCKGRLGDECPDAGVVGLVVELRELLIGDGELGSQLLEPLAHLREFSLDRHQLALEPASGDEGHLYHGSCRLLLSHEDKVFQGALIASMSIPWGEARGPFTRDEAHER